MKSLNLKISARDSRHTDGRVHLKALFDQWLPLSASLLSMVVDKLPSPMEIHSERVEKLMCSGLRTFDSLPDKTQSLKQGVSRMDQRKVINERFSRAGLGQCWRSAGAVLAQCWRSAWSARLPLMCSVFDSRSRHHMWVEFVGSLPCLKKIFSGYSGYFPLANI